MDKVQNQYINKEPEIDALLFKKILAVCMKRVICICILGLLGESACGVGYNSGGSPENICKSEFDFRPIEECVTQEAESEQCTGVEQKGICIDKKDFKIVGDGTYGQIVGMITNRESTNKFVSLQIAYSGSIVREEYVYLDIPGGGSMPVSMYIDTDEDKETKIHSLQIVEVLESQKDLDASAISIDKIQYRFDGSNYILNFKVKNDTNIVADIEVLIVVRDSTGEVIGVCGQGNSTRWLEPGEATVDDMRCPAYLSISEPVCVEAYIEYQERNIN